MRTARLQIQGLPRSCVDPAGRSAVWGVSVVLAVLAFPAVGVADALAAGHKGGTVQRQ